MSFKTGFVQRHIKHLVVFTLVTGLYFFAQLPNLSAAQLNQLAAHLIQAVGFVKGSVNRWPELQELGTSNEALVGDPRNYPVLQPGTDIGGHEHNPFFVRAPDGRYYDIAPELGFSEPQVSRGIAVADVEGDGRWVGGFVLQAFLRSVLFGTPIVAELLPMTSVMFVIYTFYMVTDPGTTPTAPLAQVVYGAAVAAIYGMLIVLHVVAAIFIALTIVCALRGLGLYAKALASRRTRTKVVQSEPAIVRVGEA